PAIPVGATPRVARPSQRRNPAAADRPRLDGHSPFAVRRSLSAAFRPRLELAVAGRLQPTNHPRQRRLRGPLAHLVAITGEADPLGPHLSLQEPGEPDGSHRLVVAAAARAGDAG